MLAQRQRRQGQMPGVLGGIFETGVVDERRASNDVFQTVGLHQEGDLLRQAICSHDRIIGDKPLAAIDTKDTKEDPAFVSIASFVVTGY
jgi:hypothetical protein